MRLTSEYESITNKDSCQLHLLTLCYEFEPCLKCYAGLSLQLLCATIKHRLVRKQDYTRGFYVPGETLNVTCCNNTNENNYRDILLILQPQCNQYGTAVHSNLLYFTLYTYCTMVNDSAHVNVNIQGLNCLKTFPLHSCFAASQPMKMRSKVSHRNTETGTCQQSAQNCQSASNDKTHEPYHRLSHTQQEGRLY